MCLCQSAFFRSSAFFEGNRDEGIKGPGVFSSCRGTSTLLAERRGEELALDFTSRGRTPSKLPAMRPSTLGKAFKGER